MVNLLFSWGFIEILRYKQTARIKPLTEMAPAHLTRRITVQIKASRIQ